MEERLIAAVADYPELYNSTLSSYKDADKKAKAWRAVSLQVELPGEEKPGCAAKKDMGRPAVTSRLIDILIALWKEQASVLAK